METESNICELAPTHGVGEGGGGVLGLAWDVAVMMPLQVQYLRLYNNYMYILRRAILILLFSSVRHVTGTGSGLLGEIPRVVVQKSALL